jgi:hypothetical protein
MAVDTFTAYVGVYPNVDAAKAGYQLVKDLHTQAGLVVVGVADMGPRSSRRCATPTRWRPGSSRPTPTRSSATPRPPGEDYAPTPPVRSAPHDRVEARKGCP